MAAAGRITPQENVTRACFASYAATAGGGRFQGKSPGAILRTLWPRDEVSGLLIERSATVPATTSASAWAGALAAESTAAFFSTLPASAASRLIASGVTIPLARRGTVVIPKRSNGPVAVPWVGESNPIPAKQYSFNESTLGPANKFAVIVTLTAELARASDASAIFEVLLREDAAFSLDGAMFGTAAATDDNPAGLLNGVTPITATTGGGLNAMEGDLGKIAGAVAANGGASIAFVMNPLQASAAAIRMPTLRLPVWSSRAIPAGRVIGLDPTAFASGFGAMPEISTSTQATIHMEDTTPLPIGTAGSPNGVAAPTRSMFQTRTIAIRIIADAAFMMRAAGLVQYIDAVTW